MASPAHQLGALYATVFARAMQPGLDPMERQACVAILDSLGGLPDRRRWRRRVPSTLGELISDAIHHRLHPDG